MIDLSTLTAHELGKCFDLSVLPKQTTEDDIRKGCRQAVQYNCAAFYCSGAYWTPVVLEELSGSDVLPAAAIGFPFGSATSVAKARETEEAVARGNRALDSVMNIGALKSGRIDDVREETRAFKQAAGDAVTKVILETGYLTDDEIRRATEVLVRGRTAAQAVLGGAPVATGSSARKAPVKKTVKKLARPSNS